MLEDINDAIDKLALKTGKTGHINLWAAKALKARLLIYKGSKFNDNQAYIDAAATAEDVISGADFHFLQTMPIAGKQQMKMAVPTKR